MADRMHAQQSRGKNQSRSRPHSRPRLERNVKARSLSWRFLAFSGVGLALLSSCAGAQVTQTIGVTDEVDESRSINEETSSDNIERGSKHADANSGNSSQNTGNLTPATQDTQRPSEEGPSSEDRAHEVNVTRAREALQRSPSSKNHLQLAIAISQRASDLKWLLAIENRSSSTISLSALPELLQIEITAPVNETDSKNEVLSKRKAAKKMVKHKTITCGSKLPKKVISSQTTQLAAGDLLVYPFDPRTFCKDEKSLRAGARVVVRYGFPVQTKKLWKGGKLVDVEREQKAPFVAQRVESAEKNFRPLKNLLAHEFTLGSTYPLSELNALAPNEKSIGESAQNIKSEPGSPTQEEERGATAPMKLTISSLGTTRSPEKKMVKVRVTNQSGQSQSLFLRRELFTYEVSGPQGEFTCRMHPADRDPMASEFRRLTGGASASLSTRLAEACPLGAWKAPGDYFVSARMNATADGKRFGLNAYVGVAVTQKPAKLTVPRPKGDVDAAPAMRVVQATNH